MTCAVRALSVFLTVWMTATAAFPPCCWSMTVAHEHQAQPDVVSSAVPSHDHHHGSTEAAAPAQALTVSAVPVYDCDTDVAEAIATPRHSSSSSIDLRMVMAATAPFALPHRSTPRAGVPEFGPPAALFDSAFLNPLRV